MASVPVANDNIRGPFPAIRFVVQDTNPIWIFCRQVQHCANGMVFALNPQNQSMLQAFQNATSQYKTASTISTPTETVSAVGIEGPTLTSDAAVLATATVIGMNTTEVITYTSYPGSAAPTSLASSDHIVMVGGADELTFDPSHLSAQPGDTITFQFTRNNHSVVQSSFEDPCTPLSRTSTTGQIGFSSGLWVASWFNVSPMYLNLNLQHCFRKRNRHPHQFHYPSERRE